MISDQSRVPFPEVPMSPSLAVRGNVLKVAVTVLLLLLVGSLALSRAGLLDSAHARGTDGYGYEERCGRDGDTTRTIDGDPLNICARWDRIQAKYDTSWHNSVDYAGLEFSFSGSSGWVSREETSSGKPDANTLVRTSEMSSFDYGGGGPVTTPYGTLTETVTYVPGAEQFKVRYDLENTTPNSLSFRAYALSMPHLGWAGNATGSAQPGSLVTRNDGEGARAEVELADGTPAPGSHSITDRYPWQRVANRSPLSNETAFSPDWYAPWMAAEWDHTGTPLQPGQTATYTLVYKVKRMPGLRMTSPWWQALPAGGSTTLTVAYWHPSGEVAGKPVRWQSTGVNNRSGTAITDGNGNASFGYTATADGRDAINAFVDLNNNGSRDAGEALAAARRFFGSRGDRPDRGDGGGGTDGGAGGGTDGGAVGGTTGGTGQSAAAPAVGGASGASASPGAVSVAQAPKDPTRVTLVRLAKFLGTGLSVSATATEPSRWRWELFLVPSSKRGKAAAKAKPRRIAVANARATKAGQKVSGRLRVNRKVKNRLRRQREVSLTLKTTVTPRSGKPVSTTRSLKIRR
jgi:hypothetical protein